MKAMKNKLFWWWLNISMVFLICSCNKSASLESEEDTSGLVALSVLEAKKMGLQWGKPSVVLVPVYVNATGTIDLPPQYVAKMSSKLKGQIKSLNGLPGDHIHKGQVLAEIENLEWVDWQESYLEGNFRLQYLEKELNRQKSLLLQDAGVAKQFEQTLAEINSLKAKQKGLETKLRFLELDLKSLINSQEMRTSFQMRAPFDGFIKSVNGTLGQTVTNEEVLLELLDPSHLHIELKVFEFQSGKIQKGQSILFQVPSKDTSWFEAEVFLVGKNIDPESKSLNVHGHIEESSFIGVPGSFVNGKIKIDQVPKLEFNRDYFWKNGTEVWGHKVIENKGQLTIQPSIVSDTTGNWLLKGKEALRTNN